MAYKPKSKTKAVWNALSDYIKKSKDTGVHIPELEALRPFFGKQGQILKRPTRSKKQQEKLEAALKAAKEKFGAKPSRQKIDKELAERKKKADEQRKKAEKTYRQRKVKEAKESEKRKFRSAAQKAAREYTKVVDTMMDASIKKLMDELGIGSDLIEYLAENGLTTEQIKAYLREISATVDDLPEEARELASTDSVINTFKQVYEDYSDQDMNEVAAIFSYKLNNTEAEDAIVDDIINMWIDAGGSENMPFADFAAEMNSTSDPYSIKNANEILQAYNTIEEEV